MKVFLTGATGFIGNHLLKRLIDNNYKVIALVRSEQDKKKIEDIGATPILGDLRKPNEFTDIIARCDIFIHLAALRTNWAAQKDFFEINSKSILRLIMKRNSLKHVIVLSSVYAMGKLSLLPADEKHPLNATDNYGKSKIKLEEFTRQICIKGKIPFTIIRPAIVYGPEDNELGMVVKLIKLIRGRKFQFIGNGKNLIHLIYINDLVGGILKVLEKPGQDQTVILAGKQPITLFNLVELIKKETRINYIPKFIYRMPLEVISFFVEKIYLSGFKVFPTLFNKDPFLSRTKISVISDNWFYDISKAKREYGFNPQIDYRQGIKKTVKYINGTD